MGSEDLTEGIVFDIQGFSVHDGPGCRTLIFLKGCPLRCPWCSNPEGISPHREPLYNPANCTLDALCIGACTLQAITRKDNTLHFDRSRCVDCSGYTCADACCTPALKIAGTRITAADLFTRITRDRPYWGDRGGITLSGGEPFLQPGFASAFLHRCYDAYIHAAAETCGHIPWANLAAAIPFLDWIFFDLKHMDPEIHRKLTGASNEQILQNARLLADSFSGRLIFRMPVIPGVNTAGENLEATASFILSTGRNEINILPLHHLGREKYPRVGKTYYTRSFDTPSNKTMEEISRAFNSFGITCYTGSDTPF